MRYPSGQPVRLSTTVKDLSGALVNATALTMTVQKPDASTQAYAAPANDGTGLYHQDVPAADLSQIGHYAYKWVATGTGAGVSYGSLEVFDPFDISVLPLQDAKDMLNIPQTTTTYDAEIQSWIDTIGAGLEKMTGGPLVNRSIVERAEVCGWREILLRKRPVVSVQSIADQAGQALSLTDLDVDTNSGVVRRRLGLPFITLWPVVTVTYTAGWGVPTPPAFNRAGAIILDHLWQTQHGPSIRPSMAGDETTVDYGLGFAIPTRAAELLAPYAAETATG